MSVNHFEPTVKRHYAKSGELLRHLRKSLDLNLKELSESLGPGVVALSAAERGIGCLTDKTVLKLASLIPHRLIEDYSVFLYLLLFEKRKAQESQGLQQAITEHFKDGFLVENGHAIPFTKYSISHCGNFLKTKKKSLRVPDAVIETISPEVKLHCILNYFDGFATVCLY